MSPVPQVNPDPESDTWPERVAIIGVGLMGGSLGLAIGARFPECQVIGWDDPASLDSAMARGAITTAGASLARTVDAADLVFLCTPVSASLDLLDELAPVLTRESIVTDIGSVKGPIVDKALRVLPAGSLFVGGHPMTGSEKQGARHADPLLYENATWVLCPPKVPDARYHNLVRFLERIGARVMELSAPRHDTIAAHVSHLPQLLSVLLVNTVQHATRAHPEVLDLAAGGFRDMTRIAGSPFGMWRDILDANQPEISTVLAVFSKELRRLADAVAKNDMATLSDAFRNAEQTRDFIPADRKGFLHPLSMIYVFVGDAPGALVQITTTLFNERINIKDIELLRIREGTGGTFRLGLESPTQADNAIRALTEAGISAYRL